MIDNCSVFLKENTIFTGSKFAWKPDAVKVFTHLAVLLLRNLSDDIFKEFIGLEKIAKYKAQWKLPIVWYQCVDEFVN